MTSRADTRLRITCITTGVVREKAGERGISRYVRDAWRESTLPVNSFLVEHPEGRLLFDTGQTARATERGYLPQWHPFLRLSRFELTDEDEVASQLEARGLRRQDIRWVFLSHLHNDHVGGVDAFKGAEVVVSRAEWERSTGVRGSLRGYVPRHWPGAITPRLLELSGPPIGPFGGSEEISGDGTIVAVSAPGHTPGHAAALVRGKRLVLLAGDLAHDFGDLERVAPEIAAWCNEQNVIFLATHDPDAPALAQEVV